MGKDEPRTDVPLKPIKIIYIISNIEKALAFEWINDFLPDSKFHLSFILIGHKGSALARYLTRSGTEVHEVRSRGKRDFPVVLANLLWYLIWHRPHVVHTHLMDANLMGLSAAWVLKIHKRVFTRHHATLHYREYPKGLKWDKWCNGIATDIIAVSKNVSDILVLRDGVLRKKVHLIPHGFDAKAFNEITADIIAKTRVRNAIPSEAFPVIGVIARYTHWKGVQFIIEAFVSIRKIYPGAHLVLANAQGDYEANIKSLLRSLPNPSYTEITFEHELGALYKNFDIYVHTPIDASCEAFGQTYVESLLSGIPSVFTLSGIATEFIVDGQNAWVVPFENSEAIFLAVKTILENKVETRRRVDNGKRTAAERFPIKGMILQLKEVYERS